MPAVASPAGRSRDDPQRDGRDEGQEPVRVRLREARLDRREQDAPTVTIAQNDVRASDAIAVDGPDVPVMYSVAQLPLVVSTIP